MNGNILNINENIIELPRISEGKLLLGLLQEAERKGIVVLSTKTNTCEVSEAIDNSEI